MPGLPSPDARERDLDTVIDLPLDPRVLTLVVALAALVLFVWNRIRADVVALVSMVALVLMGVITPHQGISGFANEAVITVAAMLALSAGLVRTGVVDDLGRWLRRASARSELRLTILVMAIVLPVSAFVNNTAAVAVLLPMVMGVARSMDVRPSRVLMPLSFASQLGGTLTLIGTSTNLLVAGLILDLGMDRIGLFDITPPAFVLAVIGAIYLLTVGRWLTPHRKGRRNLEEAYDLRRYLTSFRVRRESPLAGRSLAESRLGEREGIMVVGIRRGDEEIRGIGGDTVLQAGDVLMAEGEVRDVARFLVRRGLAAMAYTPDWSFQPEDRDSGEDAGEAEADAAEEVREAGAGAGAKEAEEEDPGEEAGERVLAELLVAPGTFPVNRPLYQVGLRSRWGISVLGLKRRGRPVSAGLARTPLMAGDVLLVEGEPERLRSVHEAGDFALLGSVDLPSRRRDKRWIALPIMAAVVLLPAFDVTTILVSAMAGVVVMFLTGCLTAQEAYEDMDWMVIVLLGGILPLGIAMQTTGTAEWIVTAALGPMEDLSPYFVLATFFVMTAGLTGMMSNNASAVVMTPLAVAIGQALDLSPLPFVIAIMIAASNSFVTPIGYQTNTFIFGPGGYRFSDFVRVGGPLNALLAVAATFVIPFFFPF